MLPAFIGACVLLAFTPGPDMAFFVARTLSGGRKLGFAALGGVMAGLLVHAGRRRWACRPCWRLPPALMRS